MAASRDAVSLVLALAGTMVSESAVTAGSVTRTTVLFVPMARSKPMLVSRPAVTVTSSRTAVAKPEKAAVTRERPGVTRSNVKRPSWSVTVDVTTPESRASI